MTPTERIREIAAAANASPTIMGKAAAYDDLPSQAKQILREFADSPFPGTVDMGTTRSKGSAFVLRKLLCGQHVVAFAAWIEA
ncbi:MAG: hypothetical protein KF723_22715 [Rhizobiaceae bacterium]|nr:hypothetical protein [Rhizobiaceae bacterium]